jgi:hypothetical protein
MPQGATPVSQSINLGQEKLVGVRLNEVGTGLTKLVVQNLVAGNEGDPSGQIWSDVLIVSTAQPPAAGFVNEPLGIATAEIVDGAEIIFPRDSCAYVLPVIRLRGEGTLATNDALFQFITDPHS